MCMYTRVDLEYFLKVNKIPVAWLQMNFYVKLKNKVHLGNRKNDFPYKCSNEDLHVLVNASRFGLHLIDVP